MTNSIDHAAEAVKRVENMVNFAEVTEVGSYEESAYIQQRVANGLAVAQVHATLAVAEQLRVANLIVLAKYEHANGSRGYQHLINHPVGEGGIDLNPEIKEALNLE